MAVKLASVILLSQSLATSFDAQMVPSIALGTRGELGASALRLVVEELQEDREHPMTPRTAETLATADLKILENVTLKSVLLIASGDPGLLLVIAGAFLIALSVQISSNSHPVLNATEASKRELVFLPPKRPVVLLVKVKRNKS